MCTAATFLGCDSHSPELNPSPSPVASYVGSSPTYRLDRADTCRYVAGNYVIRRVKCDQTDVLLSRKPVEFGLINSLLPGFGVSGHSLHVLCLELKQLSDNRV